MKIDSENLSWNRVNRFFVILSAIRQAHEPGKNLCIQALVKAKCLAACCGVFFLKRILIIQSDNFI